VAAEADFRPFPCTPVLSREAPDVPYITRGRVRADKVQQSLPWLYKLYRNDFAELAERAWREPIETAFDDRYGIVLNVQKGAGMRFECHVDSNPVTGLLFLTDHLAGGGELVVSHDPDAVPFPRDLDARAPELDRDRLEILERRVLDQNVAERRRSGNHESARLDAVWDDRVLDTAQPADSLLFTHT